MALGGRKDNDEFGGCDDYSDQSSVCTAHPATGSSDWLAGQGTSFAAPVVTSIIALYREYCDGVFPFPLDQRVFRSLLRTYALLANPDDFAYSTPTPGMDWKDGAGVVDAESVYASCHSGVGSQGGIDSIEIDLEEDNGPMPSGSSDYQDGWDPPGQTQSFTTPADFGYAPGPGSNRPWRVLEQMTVPYTSWGSRIRGTLSWDGCALDRSAYGTSGPASVSTDFDLFLYNVTTQQYLWASQSLDDNNEGFDYTLQPGEGGVLQLIVVWQEGALSCEGTTFEPAVLSWFASH